MLPAMPNQSIVTPKGKYINYVYIYLPTDIAISLLNRKTVVIKKYRGITSLDIVYDNLPLIF